MSVCPMTVCLVSPAKVESSAGVTSVRLLSCCSVYALTVCGRSTVPSIVDPASDRATLRSGVARGGFGGVKTPHCEKMCIFTA